MREKAYHPNEVAEILGISRRKVYYLVERGILKKSAEVNNIKIDQKSLHKYQKTISIEQAQDILSLSRSFVYKLILKHEIELYTVNGKPLKPFRIIAKSLRDHIDLHSRAASARHSR